MRIIICCLIMTLCCSIGRVEQAPWDCPECGRTGVTRNYCGGCGHPAPWIEGESGKLSRDDFSKVGNIVRFGRYEQDNNLDNGAEEIEWIVLDVQAGKSLLLSKYGLDAKAYNTSYAGVTWETCTLRIWLNNDFLKEAFTAWEQSSILITTVDNSNSQGFSGNCTNGGNDTQDRLFLLSYHEAFDLYFQRSDRKCAPTDYAMRRGASTDSYYKVDGRAAGWWWLRSPSDSQNKASSVNYYESRGADGLVNNASYCVRPALWIDLKSDIF